MTTFFSNLLLYLISLHSAEVQFHLSLEFISEDKCLPTKHAECTSYHSWLLQWFYLQGPRIPVASINFWKEAEFTWHKQIFRQNLWGSLSRQSATSVRYEEYWYTSIIYFRDWYPSWALSWLLVHSNGKQRKPWWCSPWWCAFKHMSCYEGN